MIFRQLFEPLSSTYTYLLGCEETGLALLIDPVIASMHRDLKELQRLGLTLAYSVDTHVHADHITAALELKKKVGSQIAVPAAEQVPVRILTLRKASRFKSVQLRSILCIHPAILQAILHTSSMTGYLPEMRC